MAGNKKGLDMQAVGAVLLGLTAVASLGVLAVYLLRGPQGGGGMGLEEEPETPDVSALPTNGVRDEPRVLNGEDVEIQITDRDDPTRLAAIMHFGELDPLPNRRYRATDTTAWVYLDSGEILLVEAPTARLAMPDGKRPESGELSGGVVMRVFDAPEDGGLPDPSRDEASLVARTPVFRFDLTIGEASAPRRLTVRTRRVDFAGRDMLATFSETRQRIEYLEVREGEQIVYRTRVDEPTPKAIAEDETAAAERVPAGEGGRAGEAARERRVVVAESPEPKGRRGPVRPARTPVKRQHYHIRFDDAIRVVQGARSIRGDRLDVWARLIDNELPEGALGEGVEDARVPMQSAPAAGTIEVMLASAVAAQPLSILAADRGVARSVSGEVIVTRQGIVEVCRIEDRPDGGASVDGGVAVRALAIHATDPSQDAADQGMGEPGEEDPEGDGTILLTWSGAMVLQPVKEIPDELREQNHVAVRFSALESGRVSFRDESSQSEGSCGTLEYRATLQRLVLSGVGPHAVRVMRAGGGLLETRRIELDLSTGVARVPGAGVAHALREGQREIDPGSPRRISWTQRADFQLARRGYRLRGDLEWAKLIGRVEAVDGQASLSGEMMDATFYPQGDERHGALRHLEVVGPVAGTDGRGASLTGERLSVDFAGRGEGRRTDPRTVSIEGSARASRDGATLRARIIDARLERSEEDHLVVAFVSAREEVRFEDPVNAVSASCDRLRGDATLRVADLEGERVVLRQGSDEIGGTQVHLNAGDRIVEVFGAGWFARRGDDDEAIAEASWTKQMVFDDRKGTLDCFGDARATWRPEALAVDDVRAERIHVELTPYREASAGDEALGVRVDREDRQVLRVRATGSALLEDGGKPAVVQSLRESPEDPPEGQERAILTLVRLEAPEVFADNEGGQIRVEHPGRLIVADYRDAGEGDAPDDPSQMRGSAVFQWSRLMVVDRNEDTITMEGDVRMTHIRTGDNQTTRLLCERLVAMFEDAGEDSLGAARLRGVRCEGSVFARSGRQELMGDELVYDARRSTLEAQATSPTGRVTFTDARTGSPTSARRIFWDLKSDRVEVRQPGVLVLPR